VTTISLLTLIQVRLSVPEFFYQKIDLSSHLRYHNSITLFKEEIPMKKFMEEFKAFALRGNVMDMAVGVIIGGAFSGIVTSLTDNFIKPILNVLTGGATYTLQDVSGFASSFISSVVNFLIMAFILFCLLKAVNKVTSLGAKKEESAAPTTKKCPFCMSEIDIKATRCPHCTSELPEE